MPNTANDDDMPWTGRPQDDPALHAAREKRFAEFRRAHPPVNCWIDKVQTIELFVDGVWRALVDRGRAVIVVYDGEGYAMEELVAELGAAFVCADLALTPQPRAEHASYIASWLKVLKDDKRAIFAAAAHAQRAADYLAGRQAGADTGPDAVAA